MKHNKNRTAFPSGVLNAKSQIELMHHDRYQQPNLQGQQHNHQSYPLSTNIHRKDHLMKNNNGDHQNYAKCAVVLSDEEDSQYEQQTKLNEENYNIAQNQVQRLSEAVKNLILKNKLNSKNAFNIPIIDVCCLKAVKTNNDSSWTKISNVLENSSKVYSYRVDSMADSISQMSNFMSFSQKTKLFDNIEKQKTKPEYIDTQLSEHETHENYIDNFNQDWLKQICKKHLGEQKINQGNSDRKFDNPNQQMARRMFDQNGISGILLVKLPITRSLNLVIDTNKQFSEKQPFQNCQINQTELSKQIILNKDLKIFEEIDHFRQFFFTNKENQPQQQIAYDCFNLQFDEDRQIFLNTNNEYLNNQQPMVQTIEYEESFHSSKKQNNYKENTKQPKLQPIFNKLITSQFSSIHLQELDEKQKKKKKNFARRKPNRSKKQIVSKKREIDFCFESGDTQIKRSQILLISEHPPDLPVKIKKFKDKKIEKILIPEFQITKETNYLPLHPHKENLISQDCINQSQIEIQKCNLAFQSQLRSLDSHFRPLDSHFRPLDSYFLTMNSNESTIYPMPNIRNTKLKLWDMIKGLSRIQYSQLYQKYERQKGYISEAILFLSLLHLCNDKNIQIKQKNQCQLQILNHNWGQV